MSITTLNSIHQELARAVDLYLDIRSSLLQAKRLLKFLLFVVYNSAVPDLFGWSKRTHNVFPIVIYYKNGMSHIF